MSGNLRSSPTYWVGEPAKHIGTRVYYSACKFENETYHVYDCVMLNCDIEPYPIARIMGMWEQAKKKWLTVQWFYRAKDIVNSFSQAAKTGKKISYAKALEYLKQVHPQELFVSSHMDDNYPSTLRCKCKVIHHSKAENLDEFLKNQTCFFFQKRIQPRDIDFIGLQSVLKTRLSAVHHLSAKGN